MSGRIWRWAVAALVAGLVRLVASYALLGHIPDPTAAMFRAGYYTVMSTMQLIVFGAVWFGLRHLAGERFAR
jgi:hypothetical protein